MLGTLCGKVHRTHSLDHVVTHRRREYWVGISRRAAPALLYLIVARNVLFHAFNGQRAVSSRAVWWSDLDGRTDDDYIASTHV